MTAFFSDPLAILPTIWGVVEEVTGAETDSLNERSLVQELKGCVQELEIELRAKKTTIKAHEQTIKVLEGIINTKAHKICDLTFANRKLHEQNLLLSKTIGINNKHCEEAFERKLNAEDQVFSQSPTAHSLCSFPSAATHSKNAFVADGSSGTSLGLTLLCIQNSKLEETIRELEASIRQMEVRQMAEARTRAQDIASLTRKLHEEVQEKKLLQQDIQSVCDQFNALSKQHHALQLSEEQHFNLMLATNEDLAEALKEAARLKQLNRELEDRDFPKRYCALCLCVRCVMPGADMVSGMCRTIHHLKEVQYRSAAAASAYLQHVMSDTDVCSWGFPASACTRQRGRRSLLVSDAIYLCACNAMHSTGAICPCACYAMCSTDILYAATGGLTLEKPRWR
eukprot:3936393-Rhodomonas_salina.2